MFVTMLPATKSENIPTSSSLCYPPNATSIMQPLDQGIILSAKRRYKKKLAERYLACVEKNKDANSLLKALDIVQATNMIAASWRETSSTIIQDCFCKAALVQTPCSRPCTYNRGSSTHPSTRSVEQG